MSYAPPPYDPNPIDDPWVIQDFVPYDHERLPPPCKLYPPGLPTTALPRDWPPIDAPATAVLAGTHVAPPAAIDLTGLARLLHLSAGVVRIRKPTPPFRQPWLFRAAGSAGGRFPLEIYVSSRGVAGLADGVHWYDPVEHALVRVGPPAGGDATTLIVTGIPWRTSWKYAERGLRHIYWDGGSMLAQTLAVAASAGLRPRLWTRFPDGLVSTLIGADGVQEFPIALVGLGAGDGEPAIRPGAAAIRGSVGEAPTEFPLITHAQHAGDMDHLGDAWPARPGAWRRRAGLGRSRHRHPAARLRAEHGSRGDRSSRGIPVRARHRAPRDDRARTSWPSMRSTAWSQASIDGRTWQARCAGASCARSCCWRAGTWISAGTRRSSS